MSEKRHLFDNPKNVKRTIWALYAVCILAFAADFVVHRYVVHPWEALPGFYAVYGLVACIALVLAAKGLRKLIGRGERHYDD